MQGFFGAKTRSCGVIPLRRTISVAVAMAVLAAAVAAGDPQESTATGQEPQHLLFLRAYAKRGAQENLFAAENSAVRMALGGLAACRDLACLDEIARDAATSDSCRLLAADYMRRLGSQEAASLALASAKGAMREMADAGAQEYYMEGMLVSLYVAYRHEPLLCNMLEEMISDHSVTESVRYVAGFLLEKLDEAGFERALHALMAGAGDADGSGKDRETSEVALVLALCVSADRRAEWDDFILREVKRYGGTLKQEVIGSLCREYPQHASEWLEAVFESRADDARDAIGAVQAAAALSKLTTGKTRARYRDFLLKAAATGEEEMRSVLSASALMAPDVAADVLAFALQSSVNREIVRHLAEYMVTRDPGCYADLAPILRQVSAGSSHDDYWAAVNPFFAERLSVEEQRRIVEMYLASEDTWCIAAAAVLAGELFPGEYTRALGRIATDAYSMEAAVYALHALERGDNAPL
ncbi:MAG: hypothetical protein ACYTAN_17825, partial [Planctomycetota bacterium]